jgi:hypothetical protein
LDVRRRRGAPLVEQQHAFYSLTREEVYRMALSMSGLGKALKNILTLGMSKKK